jgi:hypothetical protein
VVKRSGTTGGGGEKKMRPGGCARAVGSVRGVRRGSSVRFGRPSKAARVRPTTQLSCEEKSWCEIHSTSPAGPLGFAVYPSAWEIPVRSGCGRTAGRPAAPAQIPAGAIDALGSCLR